MQRLTTSISLQFCPMQHSAACAHAQVTIWFPAQFAELRRLCLADGGGEAAFAASLSRCHAWAARGGKSKSYFAKVPLLSPQLLILDPCADCASSTSADGTHEAPGLQSSLCRACAS